MAHVGGVKLHYVCVSEILQELKHNWCVILHQIVRQNTYTEFHLKLSIAYPRSEMFKLTTPLTWIDRIGLLLFKKYEMCGSAPAMKVVILLGAKSYVNPLLRMM